MFKPAVLNTAGGDGADVMSVSEKCYICLSLFEDQAVASLENCQHVFCLECILQWSQTANTCPVDRISFAHIYQRRCPGGEIQQKIKVKTRKKDAGDDDDDDEEEEEEGGSSAVICEECGRSDRRHRLLVCTQCDSGHHMDCLTPSLNTGPEDDWICPECAIVPQHADGSAMLEEEISDGELTDLLAEADETAATSGRLRPSTTSRPSSSTERRRSQRIRSRASNDPDPDPDPDPRPQTSWHVPKYLLRALKPAAATDVGAARHLSDASVKLKTRKRKKCST